MKTRLDLIAACFTGASTVYFATGLHLLAWCSLLIGSVLWGMVALRARFEGRRVWGQVASSAWTFAWSVFGLWRAMQ